MAIYGLLAMVGLLLCTLCWVAWRFFLAPPVKDSEGPVRRSGEGARLLVRGWTGRALVARCKTLWTHLGLKWLANAAVLLTFLVVALGVVGVFSLSERIGPDPLQALELYREQHIRLALNPEKLVPPQPLPPAAFVGTERVGLETADREWGKLQGEFVQVVLRVLYRLQERGYTFALLEGYRSPERQERLADQDKHVTSARAFQSKHQYGLAADLAPVRDGKLVISERDPWAMQAYQVLGEEAEKVGLVWGGRWWFRDYGHIEAPGSIQANLLPGK